MDSDFVIQRHCFEDSSEEEDDEVDEPTFTTPNLNKTDLNHGANLIIAVGQTASLFLRSHFIVDLLSSCTITTTSLRVFKDKYFPTPAQHSAGSYTVTEVYTMRQKEGNSGSSSAENFYLCVHEQPLDSRFCNQWCAKVMELVQPKLVLILTSRKSHEYLTSQPRGSDYDPTQYLLKGLHSSMWTVPLVSANLEPPNTIIGEAASVLTHCQLHLMPAAMAVSYSDSSSLTTTECVSAFEPVLVHSLFKDLQIKPKQEAMQRIKDLTPRPRGDLRNLYT